MLPTYKYGLISYSNLYSTYKELIEFYEYLRNYEGYCDVAL